MTELQWNGGELVAEYEGGLLARRYGHGPGADEPLFQIDASGTRHFHADERGSIVAVSDWTGVVMRRSTWDAWGREPEGAHPDRFGFTGQVRLDAAGLRHFKARAAIAWSMAKANRPPRTDH